MATVSGRVIFDRDRSATINAGDSGIANVPVVLQNTVTNARLVVLTDANGNYSFINVPNGDYRIVQSFGTPGGVLTPGDFNNAVVGPVPVGTNPPISFATNPPPGSTNLDSLTPDTLLVTVTGANLTNENFLDGPVIYTPIQNILDPCVSVSNVNLINVADNGTFGFFPPGTPANTGAPVEPYPGVTPDFTYVLPDPTKFTPIGGEYTVQNIMTNAMSNEIGAWWRIADHTTGNETGRMMVVNGFNPGAIFFRDVVSVQPNTNYLFSSWILNLFKVTGYPNPELGVRILDQNGNVLYSATLGAQIPVNTNAPEWKQIGTVINSQNNTSLTVEFLSEGPEVIGNDYAIDDVSLNEVQVPLFIPVKTISTPVANVGETVTYTVTLENTCTSPLTNVFFKDIVPNGLLFVAGSVTVNGVSEESSDPNIGFTIPDIPGGSTATVTFDAVVNAVPTPNPALNTATINYSYTPVEGGIENNFTVDSNTVPLEVRAPAVADISVIKMGSPNPVMSGEILTYTIDVSNLGPSDAQNVVLTDIIPPEITGAEFSTNGGITFIPWPGSFNIGTLLNQETRTILIRGTVASVAPGFITNTAEVTSTTPDPNPSNNTSTSVIEVNESTQEADVGVFKSVGLNPVPAGGMAVFPIRVSNFGPADAQNVVLTDAIPPEITGAEFSTDGGSTFSPWPGSLNIGTLPAGETINVLIRGTVSLSATGIISNTAEVSSTTPDPNPSNNTSTVDVEVIAPVEADISVVKTASPNPVTPGEVLTYTIVVANAGPNDAQNVVLTDSIPSSIIGPEFSTNGGGTFSSWPGSLNIGTLPAGQTRTILIRGTVSPSATGVIANTAIVTSSTPDPNPGNNTSTADVEVIPVVGEADISVVKTVSPNPVMPGGVITYTLVVSNAGPNAAENVVLNDNVSSSIIGPEFSTNGGGTFNPWTGSFNIGTLPVGSSRTILIRGTVSQTATGCINNTAIVTSATPDPNLLNNTSSICVEVEAAVEAADISVIKTAIPNPVTPGGVLTYTLVVSNAGPNAAENVVLTDNIPSSIIGPEFSVDGGATFNPWTGSLSIGTLPAGTSRTILIRGTVSSSAAGTITNTANVISTTPDPNPSNNTSTVNTEVAAVPGEADISVVKTASPNPVAPGRVLTYTLIVANAGPSDAQNVVLTDNIPSSIIGPEFSINGGLTFNPWPGTLSIGTLPAGTSRTILIRGTVSSSATGTITNTADVTSTTPDPDPFNNTSTVVTEVAAVPGEADVSVVKTASPNPVAPGGMLNYTIVVSNAGPADAQNVVLTDIIPSSITGPEFSIDGGVTFNPWPGSFNIGTLPAGSSRTILIRGTVSTTATGCINNTAIVTSTTPDPNPINNVSSICIEIETAAQGEADVSVEKTASPDQVMPGEVLTYIITVSNEGPSDAENVVLTDNIPPSIIEPEFSIDGGVTFDPWPGTLSIGTLPAETSRVILIIGTVSLRAKGCIVNTAKVTSTTPDPNLANNTSSACVEVCRCAHKCDKCDKWFECDECFESDESDKCLECNECFKCNRCGKIRKCSKCGKNKSCNCIRNGFS